jgi:cell division protein FtsQ
VTTVAALGWALLGSGWFEVREIVVTGTLRVPVAQVTQAAQSEVGRPVFLADLETVRSNVVRFPLVSDVKVSRSWPGTLRVEVTERTPKAALPVPEGGVVLVDRDGAEIQQVASPPLGVPLLYVNLEHSGVQSLRAALDTYLSISSQLRERTLRMGAGGPHSVWFELKDGSQVVWGAPEESDRKERVLAALRKARPAEQGGGIRKYDVSAPGAPAVR